MFLFLIIVFISRFLICWFHFIALLEVIFDFFIHCMPIRLDLVGTRMLGMQRRCQYHCIVDKLNDRSLALDDIEYDPDHRLENFEPCYFCMPIFLDNQY